MLMIFVSVSLMSCGGGKTAQPEVKGPADSVVVPVKPVDSSAVGDTTKVVTDTVTMN